jgi:hypothetical protein
MRPLALALWLFAALPAAAQTVTVRSGNHPDFVRLVFDIPPGTAWELGRIGPDYALDLGPDLGVDLGGIFERIPRDRLAGIAAGAEPGRLMLDLACSACHASAFLFRPDKLVIDVIDGPPPADSPWEAQPAAPLPEAPMGTGLPLLAATLPPATLLFAPPGPEEPKDADPMIGNLAADMARAVAAGILDAPAGATSAAGDPALAADPDTAATAPPAPAAPAGPAEPARPGVNFITADRLARTTPSARELGRNGQPCIPESEFDLAAWGPTGDFAQDVGSLRREIVDAAGATDGPVLKSLARAYLHFGFGAEARQALALMEEESTTTRLLGRLANLIDGRPVPAGAFADQAGCLTPATLWAALAEGTVEGSSAAERTAIEAAFRVLPTGPRQAVAPRLAALFLAAGHTESAATMLARMPAEGTASDEAVAVQSDIIRTATSAVAARESLLSAIRDGSRASAGTMIRLVDATLAAGLPVDPWMIDTLTGLRFEYRGGPMEGRLATAEIRALTATDRFAEAAVLLAMPDLPLEPDDRTTLGAEVALALAGRAGDAQFLDLVFDDRLKVPAGAAANAVAGRLIALGFPDVALGLLDPPAAGDLMGERRVLRAAALRALGQDEEAALVLAGMAPATQMPQDGTSAWREGNWDAMSATGDPLLTEVAAAVLDDTPPPPGDTSLAGRAALIGAAEETRKLAEALLDRFPPPGTAELAPVSSN